MAQQKIQLRLTRDFGQNISDTFQFIRQEFKPLASAFALIAGIFILAHSITVGFFQTNMFAILNSFEPGNNYDNADVLASVFTPTYFMVVIFSLVNIVVMRTVIAAYMKLYDENEESPTVPMVWKEFLRQVPKTFLYHIPAFIIIIISFVFCFFPIIYTMVVFLPLTFIIVNENIGFGKSFSRCFTLIKENFWMSLGIYLVAFLIYYMASLLIGTFIGIIAGTASYFTTKEIGTVAGAVTSVFTFVGYIFYMVFYISVGLHYYNLVEALDGIGLSRRLDSLGGNTNTNTIEEQY